MLLGVSHVGWAAPAGKKPRKESAAKRSLGKSLIKSKKKSTKEESPTLPKEEPAKPPRLRKPRLLKEASMTAIDPLIALDKLLVKQEKVSHPYVPILQSIHLAFDYSPCIMKLWVPKEEWQYVGILSVLFRHNIQLSGTLGYTKLGPEAMQSNAYSYTTTGIYCCPGLDYFVNYNARNNLYGGLRYGRSYFENKTIPEVATGPSISHKLKASWWELVVGSEHQLLHDIGLYAGLILHVKGLASFDHFSPASNYIVPGYGRCVNPVVPGLTLYLKYSVSFMEKKFTFAAH